MKRLPPADAFDIIAVILSTVALIPNTAIFLPLLCEQIKTGWGFPTHFEMMVLGFWFCQFLTLPFILVCLGYTLFCLIKHKISVLFPLYTALLILTLVSLVLSIVFEYN